MTLGLYFARRFLGMAAIIVGVVATLMTLVEMVELIRSNAATAMTVADAAQLAALKAPRSVYQALPLLILMAAIALFLALARSSELVVARAAGRSALRAASAPALAAFFTGVVAVAFLNPLVAATSRTYDQFFSSVTSGSDSLLQISADGLWLRQSGADGQTLIRAARSNQDGTELMGVTFLTFDAGGVPRRHIVAGMARLAPGEWRLTDVKEWQLDAPNPERTAVEIPRATLATDLTVDRIRDSFGSTLTIAIWDLPAFIYSLERAGFSSREQRVWLQMELAQPLMLAAMVLLAAGFTMRHSRFGRSGQMILAALLAGFGMFVLRNFAQLLGSEGQIPVVLAAWAAPLVTLMLAVALLLHLEDG